MEILKVINNNVVLVSNGKQEMMVMGRGLGFQKKPGQTVDPNLIEKKFTLEPTTSHEVLNDLYKDMQHEEIQVLLAIIDKAEKELKTKYYSNLYISLADHLHYLIERARQDIQIKNPLAWEVKKFYKNEFKIGLYGIALLKEKFKIEILDDEAASIALHLVNAQNNGHLMEQTIRITRLVQEIIDIVRRTYQMELDEESLSYIRFVTHLQFFAQRVINGQSHENTDSFLFEQVVLNYPQAHNCAKKIQHLVEEYYHFPLGDDELIYLTIHIQRVTS